MILDEKIEITLTSRNIRYYEGLGYEIPRVYDKKHRKYVVKIGTKINVFIKDIPPHSETKIHVKCDNDECVECSHVSMNNYNSVTHNQTIPYYCRKCAMKIRYVETCMEKYGIPNNLTDETKRKIKQTCIEKFGVDNVFKSEEIKEKIKKTNLEKYGVEHVMYSDNIKEKVKATNLERYGVEHPSQNKEIQEKIQQTCMKKFGTINALHSDEIKEKVKQTMLERYGVEYPSQNDEVKRKIRTSMYKNNTCPTSNQQLYLHNLYGGELNYPFKQYNLDIYLCNEKIDIEYNGSGHDLSVKLGTFIQEEFNRKEIIRNSYLKNANMKRITITSSQDYIPSDTILLQMLDLARNYFSSTSHTWIEFNIDESLYRNAEHLQGALFDYGKLRKITNKDLEFEEVAV